MLDVANAPQAGPGDLERVPAVSAGIRPFAPEDIAAVSRLFRQTFTRRSRAGARPLEDTLRREFFEHPWRDARLPSLVFCESDGTVTGFIGVRPLRLLLDGVPVDGAVGGSLMIDRAARAANGGPRLLRSFLNGPQDISLSESANAVSRPMWDKLGGQTEPAYSMEWLRVFKPAGFGVTIAAERVALARLLRPLATAFDWCGARLRRNPFRVDATADRGADVGIDELTDAILRLSSSYALRPDWDRDSIRWFLEQTSEKERYGPIVMRVVRERRGAVVGAYAYCVRPGGVGFVLQVLAEQKARENVVDDLLADASRRGAVALRGRVQPELADVLLRRRAVFVHSSSMVVRSGHGAALAVIQAGGALVTGLAGEAWSGLIGL